MSIIKQLFKSVTSLLGMGAPKMPEAKVPAAPAPTRRTDTGASVVIGSQSANARVSGSGTPQPRKVDVLGSLGLGGLNF